MEREDDRPCMGVQHRQAHCGQRSRHTLDELDGWWHALRKRWRRWAHVQQHYVPGWGEDLSCLCVCQVGLVKRGAGLERIQTLPGQLAICQRLSKRQTYESTASCDQEGEALLVGHEDWSRSLQAEHEANLLIRIRLGSLHVGVQLHVGVLARTWA